MKQQWFTIKNIRPQLWALAEFQHVEKTVMYLAVGKSQALLVDTGTGTYSIHKVIHTITKLPLTVLLTHHHWDHIGGLRNTGTLYHGERIEDFSIRTIATPGHTLDSVCYFFKKQNWLFVGDTLYPGPLYAHLPESNTSDYAKSLQKLCMIANKQTLILPGHNATTCDYQLLVDAAILMGEIVHKKVIGKGFSILLP